MLLNSYERMHSTFTQDAPLMTEDMHEEWSQPQHFRNTVHGRHPVHRDEEWFSGVESGSSLGSLENSDEEGSKRKFKWFDDSTIENPELELGQMFKTVEQFRIALVNWNLVRGCDIRLVKNEKTRVSTVCSFAPPSKKRLKCQQSTTTTTGESAATATSLTLQEAQPTQTGKEVFCHWRIHASPCLGIGFQIKSFNNHHICGRSYKNHLADFRYIART